MKGRILTFLLILLLNAAAAFAQADRHDVRQGNRHFERGDFGAAELAYRKGLVKDSLSTAARYNLASSLYRQENFEGAKEIMGSFDGQEVSSDIHYNTGDIALQLKDYASAVEAFRQSLLQNPGDLDAKENYIYAKKMLENQQKCWKTSRTGRTEVRTNRRIRMTMKARMIRISPDSSPNPNPARMTVTGEMTAPETKLRFLPSKLSRC